MADQSARHGVDYEPMDDPDISDYKTLYLREKTHSDRLRRERRDEAAAAETYLAWGRDMRDMMCVLDAAVVTAAERMGPRGERDAIVMPRMSRRQSTGRGCARCGV